ncbi:MAG: ABC transporter permease [Opitutaceae bacterium]
MSLWKRLRFRCRALANKPQLDAEMTDEMSRHVELQTGLNLQAGMDAKEARYAALRQFGNVARIQEECREQRGLVWLEQWGRDIRFSLRSLRRSAGFTAAVIVTLTLCIGANTTIMSVLYGLIVKPMPFSDSGQLVEVYNSSPKSNRPKLRTSVVQYLDYKANADLFSSFALWTVWTFNIGEEADPERGIGARVTADYFTLLGVQPLLGRFYTMEECVPGKDAVLVLTETFWERKFHSDPGVVGRVIKLGGESFTIIGVAPRSLEALNTDTTVLKPFEWQPQQANPQARFGQTAVMYARVKPGVAHSAALAQLDTFEKRYQEIMPADRLAFLEKIGFQVRLNGVRAEQTKSVRTSLLMLQGGALFVLLLGSVNVANLMLARANARQAELALRQALGAGRGAIARQMLVEGVLLAGGGAVLGLALAWASLRLINTYTTSIVREVDPIRLDGTILSVTLLVTCAVAGLIALLPVVKTWRTNLLVSLQGGTRGASAGGGMRNASGLLVTAQVALALMLLIGASLLLRSFTRVLAIDPGFDAAHVVQGRTVFGFPGQTQEGIKSTQDLILERMKEIQGVEQVAYTGSFPLFAGFPTSSFPVQGMAAQGTDAIPTAYFIMVSPDYFEVMGMRLLEGRGFTEADTPGPTGPPRALIVDQNFARKYFPDRSAVGEAALISGPNMKPEDMPRIVGVVSAARLSGLEDVSGIPFVFIPIGTSPAFSLVLRTSRPASVVVPLMREKLRSVDPSAPLYHEGPLRDDLDGMLANRRGVMWLLAAFAGIALLLSVVGIYGMLAYDVSQRTKEIGIRSAIGASRAQIVSLILKQGLWKTGIGLVIGLGGAFYLSRYMGSLLFEVEPTDLLVFTSVPLLLVSVAVLASWLPARRAAKVDPVIALRAE